MADHESLVTAATRHLDTLGGLAALAAATVEGLTAAERETRLGGLLRGLAALIDQQREHAANLLQLAEDAADASEAPSTAQQAGH
jgi:hypothetical protein